MDQQNYSEAQSYTDKVLQVLQRKREVKGGPLGASLRQPLNSNIMQNSPGREAIFMSEGTFQRREPPVNYLSDPRDKSRNSQKSKQSLSPSSDVRLGNFIRRERLHEQSQISKLPNMIEDLYGRP